MDTSNAQGAPMMCAVIVLLAVVFIGGVALSFQGNVHF